LNLKPAIDVGKKPGRNLLRTSSRGGVKNFVNRHMTYKRVFTD